jgi:hypothetical protein
VLRAQYLVPLARWNIPPPMVGDLTLWDFAQLTDAIDAQARAQQPHHADGR